MLTRGRDGRRRRRSALASGGACCCVGLHLRLVEQRRQHKVRRQRAVEVD